MLLAGQSITAVAQELGVSRETIHRWQRSDWTFTAALNRGKQELQQAAQSRLLSVWEKAADNLATAIENGDLKASVMLLRGMGGLSGTTPAIGLDDPLRLAENAEIAAKEAESYAALRRTLTF